MKIANPHLLRVCFSGFARSRRWASSAPRKPTPASSWERPSAEKRSTRRSWPARRAMATTSPAPFAPFSIPPGSSAEHWTLFGAVSRRYSQPYFYEDFSTPGHAFQAERSPGQRELFALLGTIAPWSFAPGNCPSAFGLFSCAMTTR